LYEDAEYSYDKAIEIDEGFAEVYNGKAILFAEKKENDKALEYVREALRLKSSLVIAMENLQKLLILNTKGGNYESFWDFWSGTRTKKIVATSLVVAIAAMLLYPIVLGHQTIKEKNRQFYSRVLFYPTQVIVLMKQEIRTLL